MLYNSPPHGELPLWSIYVWYFKEKQPMKNTLRAAALLCVLVGTYVMAAVPQVSARDGGDIPVCPPRAQLGKCK
jgi:hypothetical protein